jgi:hypothetical protein
MGVAELKFMGFVRMQRDEEGVGRGVGKARRVPMPSQSTSLSLSFPLAIFPPSPSLFLLPPSVFLSIALFPAHSRSVPSLFFTRARSRTHNFTRTRAHTHAHTNTHTHAHAHARTHTRQLATLLTRLCLRLTAEATPAPLPDGPAAPPHVDDAPAARRTSRAAAAAAAVAAAVASTPPQVEGRGGRRGLQDVTCDT